MILIKIRQFVLKALTSLVLVVLIVTGSMVTLAVSNKPIGELLVTAVETTDNQGVTVNGEPAKSGRTVFSGSTIATSESSAATINLGKAGKLELAPGTIFTLIVSDNAVSGNLTSGSVTVLNSAESVAVVTLTGESVTLNSGETVSANSTSAAKAAKPGPGGLDWAVWALILGGAAAAIIIIAVSGDDDNVVSPIR